MSQNALEMLAHHCYAECFDLSTRYHCFLSQLLIKPPPPQKKEVSVGRSGAELPSCSPAVVFQTREQLKYMLILGSVFAAVPQRGATEYFQSDSDIFEGL